MLKLNQRESWTGFLFATYGVPALLMIAVLPVNHRQACACLLGSAPMIHGPLPTVFCPACKFNSSTPLTSGEPSAAVTYADDPLVGASNPCDAPVSFWFHLPSRAHSPPSA